MVSQFLSGFIVRPPTTEIMAADKNRDPAAVRTLLLGDMPGPITSRKKPATKSEIAKQCIGPPQTVRAPLPCRGGLVPSIGDNRATDPTQRLLGEILVFERHATKNDRKLPLSGSIRYQLQLHCMRIRCAGDVEDMVLTSHSARRAPVRVGSTQLCGWWAHEVHLKPYNRRICTHHPLKPKSL